MDSFGKFSDDKLSDRCAFFSSLKNECISEKDYSHAINIWNTFKINAMGDYPDLYLKTDFLLLSIIAYTKKYLQSDWLRGAQYWRYLYSVFNICIL